MAIPPSTKLLGILAIDVMNRIVKALLKGGVYGGFLVAGGIVARDMAYQNRLKDIRNELILYIERADGEPGISLKDRLDFAERAGLLESETSKMSNFGYDFDLRDFGSEKLEKALNSYKSLKRE